MVEAVRASWAAGTCPTSAGAAPALRPHRAAPARRPAACSPTSRSPRAATTRAPSARSRRCAGASGRGRSGRWWPRRGSSRPPGVRELVLIAQDTTRYGEDLGSGRAACGAAGGAAGGDRRSRGSAFMYAYPTTLDEGVFDAHGARAAARAVPRHAAPARVANGAQGDAARRRRRRASPELVARARARGARRSPCARPSSSASPGRARRSSRSCSASWTRCASTTLGVFAYSWQEENPGRRPRRPGAAAGSRSERRARLMRRSRSGSPARATARCGAAGCAALVDGPSPESELLLQGRLARQAPEVDGRVLF